MIETETMWSEFVSAMLQFPAPMAGLFLFFALPLVYAGYRLVVQWRRYNAGADPRRWSHLFGPSLASGERPPLLIGSHRGFGKRAAPPENSEAAFEAAIRAGIDCIETDMIMTADGVPIIRHGPTAELAGRPDLKLAGMTLAEMRELDFSRYLADDTLAVKRDDKAWTGFLTLEEFLEKYSERDVILNLELKRWDIIDWRFERRVAEILRPYVEQGSRIFCSSFNPFSLLRLRRYLPQVCLGMLWRDDLYWFAANRSLFFFTRPDFVQPYQKRLDEKLIAYARKKGYRIHTWVINDAKRFREVRDMGVDMIITDDVREALKWAGRPGATGGGVAAEEDSLPRAM